MIPTIVPRSLESFRRFLIPYTEDHIACTRSMFVVYLSSTPYVTACWRGPVPMPGTALLRQWSSCIFAIVRLRPVIHRAEFRYLLAVLILTLCSRVSLMSRLSYHHSTSNRGFVDFAECKVAVHHVSFTPSPLVIPHIR